MAVVVVNYRTAQLVIEGLRALQAEIAAHPGTRVYVVDNDSQDGSVQAIAEAIRASGWADWAVLLHSSVNGGFTYGNNFAVRPLLASTPAPDFFWLLNPDTVVRAGALQALLDFRQRHPKAGIIGGSFKEAYEAR